MGRKWFSNVPFIKSTGAWDLAAGSAAAVASGLQAPAIQVWQYSSAAMVGMNLLTIGALCARRYIEYDHSAINGKKDKLEAALKVIWNSLNATDGDQPDPSLRLSVYIPQPREMLERCTRFIGEKNQDSDEGILIPDTVGTVGRAARLKTKRRFADLPAGKDLFQFLVDDLSFSASLAHAVRKDRKSWCSQPVGADNGTLLAVLACDSSQHLFFGPYDPPSVTSTTPPTPVTPPATPAAVPRAKRRKAGTPVVNNPQPTLAVTSVSTPGNSQQLHPRQRISETAAISIAEIFAGM